MRNLKSFAILATGALVLAAIVSWTNSNSQAFAPISPLSRIDPLEMMTAAKGLPVQTYEDRTFIF